MFHILTPSSIFIITLTEQISLYIIIGWPRNCLYCISTIGCHHIKSIYGDVNLIDTCFYIKKEFFQPLFRALPAKKRILLTIYFSLFSLRLIQQYTSANGRVVKSMDLSSNVRMYAWVCTTPPPPPPPFLLIFFPYFFHRFSHNLFFHLHSTTVRRVGGGGGGSEGEKPV